MRRQQFLDVLEQGLAVEAELEGQVILEGVEIGVAFRQEGEQGLGLGCEIEGRTNDGIVEGYDATAIAGTEQLLARLIPQGEREHAAEAFDAVLAPLAVGL